jgi:hypothetical protein
MMGRMALFDAGAARSSRARDAVDTLRDLPRATVLYAAAVAVALGVFAQMRTGSVVVTCQREGAALPACDLDRRVFFGAISLWRERVTGVERARAAGRSGYKGRPENTSFVVVLDTADGPREVGWSLVDGPAADLTNTINSRIAGGASRFEATLQPGFIDGLARLFSNGCLVVGAGLALLWAARRLRRARPDEAR